MAVKIGEPLGVVILPDDDTAAWPIEGVSGWLDRWGGFHGNGPEAEARARYAGATHLPCARCGHPVPKQAIRSCEACREKKAKAVYKARPRRHWNGDGPVYSEAADEYFDLDEEIDYYCEKNNMAWAGLRLRICEEIPYPQLDEEFYYLGQEDLDIGLPPDLKEAIENLNIVARRARSNTFQPTKYAMAMPGESITDGESK